MRSVLFSSSGLMGCARAFVGALRALAMLRGPP